MLLDCNVTGLVSCSDILGTLLRLCFVRLRVTTLNKNIRGLAVVSKNVLLVISDMILKGVVNLIYIPIYSTISRIPTTLRYLPLLPKMTDLRL